MDSNSSTQEQKKPQLSWLFKKKPEETPQEEAQPVVPTTEAEADTPKSSLGGSLWPTKMKAESEASKDRDTGAPVNSESVSKAKSSFLGLLANVPSSQSEPPKGSLFGALKSPKSSSSKKTLPLTLWIQNILNRTVSDKESPASKISNILEGEDQALRNWVSFLRAQTKLQYDEQLKEALLSTLDNIVEEVFIPDSSIDINSEEFNISLKDIVKHKMNRRFTSFSYDFRKSLKPSINKSLVPKKEKIKSNRKQASFSEFGVLHSTYSFGKEERVIDFAHQRSPGPAFYEPIVKSLRKNPSVSLSLDKTNRGNFIKAEETPGPGEYYPTKLYISN